MDLLEELIGQTKEDLKKLFDNENAVYKEALSEGKTCKRPIYDFFKYFNYLEKCEIPLQIWQYLEYSKHNVTHQRKCLNYMKDIVNDYENEVEQEILFQNSKRKFDEQRAIANAVKSEEPNLGMC